ncbi:opioid growth factor receptor-like protein 1 isoform X2 [Coregonus clupeaformis]|uniref:opioid growth factor receptor-like protein 1 isoform X2 n=1 Tax=Coregonus clupeaformis TaxID=59861 RepID=UPI001E1C72CF|nr:opioid growth factor receptor-like protein 1 isoform X2 [Coregonus clupeaformis]
MLRRIERLWPFFLVPVLSYLPWRLFMGNCFAWLLERTGKCIMPSDRDSPESLPSEGVRSPESLPSEGVGSPESLPIQEVESPEPLPSEGVGSPESRPSEEVESPESLPSGALGSPESLFSEEVESPESLPIQEVESPEPLPSEEVESPESLPSGALGSPESLFSEEVESPESLPIQEVESPEPLPSEGVESPESLPSGGVGNPESLPSGKVKRPESDEYYCEYDSTWEDPPSKETSRQRPQHVWVHQDTGWSQKSHRFNRFRSAARDMQKYRRDYPEHRTHLYFGGQQQDDMPNLQFYRGQIPSSPDGVFIEDFHYKWKRQYSQLERVHSYIQWLFPLQEPGMNYQAKELTKKEIEAFLEDETAKKRLVKSYKLMLDFYGIQMSNETTGEVRRANNWRDRFDNLDRHTHNNLRITRILKCLGTLGFPHYQAPLVRFFLEETLVKGKLYNVKESVLNYFIFAVIDKQERRDLVEYAYKHYEPKHEFVWCPKKIQMTFSNGEELSDNRQPMAGHYQHGNYLDDRDVSDDLSVPHNAIVSTTVSIRPEGKNNSVKEQSPQDLSQSLEKTTEVPAIEPCPKDPSQSQVQTTEGPAIEPCPKDPSQSQVQTTEGPAIEPCPKDPSQSQVQTTEGPAIEPSPHKVSLSQVNKARTRDGTKGPRPKKPRIGETT